MLKNLPLSLSACLDNKEDSGAAAPSTPRDVVPPETPAAPRGGGAAAESPVKAAAGPTEGPPEREGVGGGAASQDGAPDQRIDVDIVRRASSLSPGSGCAKGLPRREKIFALFFFLSSSFPFLLFIFLVFVSLLFFMFS